MSAIAFSVSSSRRTYADQPSKPIVPPSAVPNPTVNTRTPWSAAHFAASSGSGPVVRRPSLNRIIAPDLYDPGVTGVNGGLSLFALSLSCFKLRDPLRVNPPEKTRSEERRVGKECSAACWPEQEK